MTPDELLQLNELACDHVDWQESGKGHHAYGALTAFVDSLLAAHAQDAARWRETMRAMRARRIEVRLPEDSPMVCMLPLFFAEWIDAALAAGAPPQ